MDKLLWYGSVTWDYLAQMLPCALAASVVFFCVQPVRKRRLAAKGLASGRAREGGVLFFVLFCAGLGALTLFPAGFWSWEHWHRVLRGELPVFSPVDYAERLCAIQLIPLQNIFASGGRMGWGQYMLLGNVVMFAPLGFFSALLWRAPHWWKAMLVGFCTSLSIEIIQFFVGRSSDVNDVLLNTLGALCGFWLFCLLYRSCPRFTVKFQCTRIEEVPHGRET